MKPARGRLDPPVEPSRAGFDRRREKVSPQFGDPADASRYGSVHERYPLMPDKAMEPRCLDSSRRGR
jgi:hypothetical protein